MKKLTAAQREAYARDYHETCDKADRLAAQDRVPEALRLWESFTRRWDPLLSEVSSA